ncbi:MAG: T9SS type A sorting domain-containing protein [Bacteroidales bacterium]|nr:T9SS type A sorting domain-containing protein [Bacteroidales bacterium]
MINRLSNPVCIIFLVAFSLSIHAQWDNPLVYYQFNDTSGMLVVDSSGNGFNADSDCNTCWEAEGKFNGAFHFSASERIDLPAKDIALTTGEGTVAFWVLLPELSANNINCIWWAGEYGGDMFGDENEMHVCTEAGLNDKWWDHSEVAFVIVDSMADHQYFIYSDPWKGPVPATTPSENAISIADNSWHHVACTWDTGSTVALYLDGQVIWDSMAYTPSRIWSCNLMTLGVANKRTNRKLNGYLDEFRLYNVALEAADIDTIYKYVPEVDTADTTTVEGINKTGIAALNFYPNPAGNNISFFNSLCIQTIEIYGLTGEKLIVQQVFTTNEIVEIPIDQLSSGFYFIRAFDNKKLVAVGKFSKK